MQQDLFDQSDYATPLTPAQLQAAQMLAAGQKKAAIALVLKVKVTDLNAWEKSDAFRAEVGRILSDNLGEAKMELRKLMGAAIKAIGDTLEGGDEECPIPAHVRLGAAFKLLEIVGIGAGKGAISLEEFVPEKPAKKARITPDQVQRITEDVYGLGGEEPN